MQFFYDAIACGVLASLTWAALVWMLPSNFVGSAKAWMQGAFLVGAANIFVWLALLGLNLRWIPLWVFCFLMINAAIARLVFPLCDGLQIPKVWSVLIHPIVIALITVLFGGAIGIL